MTGIDRWGGQPSGAEALYEARCAYWESLTERQVAGLDPVLSFEDWLQVPQARPA